MYLRGEMEDWRERMRSERRCFWFFEAVRMILDSEMAR
jgi:hypothetical protein